MQEKIEILKVRFDKITLNEAAEKATKWAKESKQRLITTPNPEIVLEAQKNSKFLEILNKSDINIADGTGILWASRYIWGTEGIKSKAIKVIKAAISLSSIFLFPNYIKKILPERVTGVDLMETICEKSQNSDNKIFLLGAADNIAQITKDVLEIKYKGINIVGTHAGTPNEKDKKNIVEKINNSYANILFVAYGAPKQEMWIERNLKKLNSVKVAMGVGGAFDFISKTKKRAPKLMQKTGTEWLYRLCKEPSRIKRIYNATIKFPIMVFKNNN
jgi:N-acetylglucosaminyldiphosphoundecaprenol N-acetyl-beta-D-mannosaminyltransferase